MEVAGNKVYGTLSSSLDIKKAFNKCDCPRKEELLEIFYTVPLYFWTLSRNYFCDQEKNRI